MVLRIRVRPLFVKEKSTEWKSLPAPVLLPIPLLRKRQMASEGRIGGVGLSAKRKAHIPGRNGASFLNEKRAPSSGIKPMGEI
jgi:hypothetical protein